MGHPAVSQFHC